MEKTLDELRQSIKDERRFVDKKPYSHNIISLTLRIISERYGKEEANKTVRDFKLNQLGWSEVN